VEEKAQEATLINIGAGLSGGRSWRSFDASPTLRISKIPLFGNLMLRLVGAPSWKKDTRYGDILKGLPLKEGSCDILFSSHTFEHFSLSDFDKALKNVRRYLKRGGIFRIIVPDLEIRARKYVQRLESGKEISQAAIDFLCSTGLGCEASRASFWGRLREAFANSRHQWLWDRSSLVQRLEDHGFKNIKICKYREWSDARIGEVEDSGRHQDAICLECVK
jgi:SAM-dependent methyltransferase